MSPSHRARNKFQLSIVALIAASVPSGAPAEEVRLLYEVTQGTHLVIGSIVGVETFHLPWERLAFIGLTIDLDSNTASARPYGSNIKPGRFLYDSAGDLVIENSLVVDNRIQEVELVPNPGSSDGDVENGFTIDFDDESIGMEAAVWRRCFSLSCPCGATDCPWGWILSDVRGVAIPIDFGDADQDHKTDLADLGAIVECVDGPDVEVDPSCDFTDGNGDFQVDLADVALMQRTWNPSAPR